MQELINCYMDELSFKNLVINKLSKIQKSSLYFGGGFMLLGMLFSFYKWIKEINLYWLLCLGSFQLLFFIVTSITVNSLMVNEYSHRAKWTNAFYYDLSKLNSFREGEIIKLLEQMSYTKPDQIKHIMLMLERDERQNRLTGIITKTIFTASLIALVHFSVQSVFESNTTGSLWAALSNSIFFIGVLTFVAALFELMLFSIFSDIAPANKKMYSNLRAILDEALLKSYITF